MEYGSWQAAWTTIWAFLSCATSDTLLTLPCLSFLFCRLRNPHSTCLGTCSEGECDNSLQRSECLRDSVCRGHLPPRSALAEAGDESTGKPGPCPHLTIQSQRTRANQMVMQTNGKLTGLWEGHGSCASCVREAQEGKTLERVAGVNQRRRKGRPSGRTNKASKALWKEKL